jgi:hypothetical protein
MILRASSTKESEVIVQILNQIALIILEITQDAALISRLTTLCI